MVDKRMFHKVQEYKSGRLVYCTSKGGREV